MKKVIALLLMLSMLLCSVAVADTEAAEPSYTYNTAASEFPTNWSPFSNQTATDNDITGLHPQRFLYLSIRISIATWSCRTPSLISRLT